MPPPTGPDCCRRAPSSRGRDDRELRTKVDAAYWVKYSRFGAATVDRMIGTTPPRRRSGSCGPGLVRRSGRRAAARPATVSPCGRRASAAGPRTSWRAGRGAARTATGRRLRRRAARRADAGAVLHPGGREAAGVADDADALPEVAPVHRLPEPDVLAVGPDQRLGFGVAGRVLPQRGQDRARVLDVEPGGPYDGGRDRVEGQDQRVSRCRGQPGGGADELGGRLAGGQGCDQVERDGLHVVSGRSRGGGWWPGARSRGMTSTLQQEAGRSGSGHPAQTASSWADAALFLVPGVSPRGRLVTTAVANRRLTAMSLASMRSCRTVCSAPSGMKELSAK